MDNTQCMISISCISSTFRKTTSDIIKNMKHITNHVKFKINNAIEQGYLDKIVFTVYQSAETQQLLFERYTFNINWTDSGIAEIYITSKAKKNNIKKITQSKKKQLLTKTDIERGFKSLNWVCISIENAIFTISIDNKSKLKLKIFSKC